MTSRQFLAFLYAAFISKICYKSPSKKARNSLHSHLLLLKCSSNSPFYCNVTAIWLAKHIIEFLYRFLLHTWKHMPIHSQSRLNICVS